jgi:hypothetical protein
VLSRRLQSLINNLWGKRKETGRDMSGLCLKNANDQVKLNRSIKKSTNFVDHPSMIVSNTRVKVTSAILGEYHVRLSYH